MARMPALRPTLLSDPILQKAEPAHRKMARMPVLQRSGLKCKMTSQQKHCLGEFSTTSKHTHQLLVGSPCLHCCSTKPSWPQTNPPSNWRNQHCNRTAWMTSRSHRLGSGSPCRGLCSTTPSLALTILLANLRNRRRNCTDRPVARRAEELA
jgi:hypothetical protein